MTSISAENLMLNVFCKRGACRFFRKGSSQTFIFIFFSVSMKKKYGVQNEMFALNQFLDSAFIFHTTNMDCKRVLSSLIFFKTQTRSLFFASGRKQQQTL